MSNNHFNKHQTMATLTSDVTVRDERDGDRAALERLAGLDSSRSLLGPSLVAEVGGEIRAAISVLDGSVIADPFHRTDDLVRMLRLRAGLPERSRSTGVRAFGRSRWGAKEPHPSAPSVPGIPALPSHSA